MVGFMKATTRMTKRKVKVYSSGQMADATEVNGRMANSMDVEFMLRAMDKRKKANGKRANASNGSL